tara:strand:+ start:2077 stop:2862 length:786 start_codon:yes stop_codon:yes gene_type:complete
MTTTVAFNKSWNSPLTAWNTDTWNGGGAFPSATGSINSVSITISQEVTGVAATSAIGNTFETNVGVSATASVGAIILEGDARVTPTGVSGTTALGNVFETQNGVSGTTALGNTFETNVGVSATGGVGSTTVVVNAETSVTGLSGTTALGNTFETNVGVSATASVDSAALGITGIANIELPPSTLEATTSIESVTIDLGSTAEVTGLSATTSMGQVLVWGLVVPNQTPNFSIVAPSQTPNFNTIGGSAAPPLQVPSWIDKAA